MNKNIKEKWKKDLARYPKKPWLKEPSIWVVYWHRHGQSVDLMKQGIFKLIQTKLYWFIYHILTLITGISLSKSIKSEGGIRIFHFGNIFLHQNVVLGKNCTLRQGVTIGNRHNDESAPIIGDDVEFGAYAQILGKVTIGKNSKIGAMSVVLNDIPENSTACGIPAKILKKA